MNILPSAHNSDLVVQELENETLLYDMQNHKAFCLNETCSIIWKNCDGQTKTKELADKNNLTEELIELAINELQKYNLIKEKIETQVPKDKVERRKFLVKAATMAAVAIPTVSTIVAPRAVNAQSCAGTGPLMPLPANAPAANSPACGNYCVSPCCMSGNAVSTYSGGICSCLAVVCN